MRELKKGEHYDVGVYGWWGHENFGGCLTYYALERTLKSMGYSVLMIQEAEGLPGRYKISEDCIAMQFAKKNYNYTQQVDYNDLVKFNDVCDRFIIGGDQMWNYRLPFVKSDTFLNFVHDDKIKISYSTSFGACVHNPSDEYLKEMAPLLRRFNAISVREDYAVDIARDIYNAKAETVIDAVFLPDKQIYDEAAEDSDCELSQNCLVAYILNPTKEKRAQIEIIAKRLNLNILLIPDAAAGNHAKFNEVFNGLNILTPLTVNNFLKAYKNAKYVITDSFHGICMCYIFKKDFNCYYNIDRGADRMVSLMKILKQESRLIDPMQTEHELIVSVNIGFNVDWTESNKNIQKERNFALNWLKNSLNSKKTNETYPSECFSNDITDLNSNFDFIKIRILATLLRDYGIKHIVLSPGGRDVPLIRMFEHNEHEFTLHRVTDERSAAYFGLGLASQLKQPVVCVCTSGTAASNYLPAVTEAYYTGVPLIMITADRYGVYLNHGEDQTIPQKHIYNGVVKKEVSLPETGGYLNEYQTRRDISECILETTHNGYGPVHINVPIQNIAIGANLSKYHWRLLPFIYPHILRVGFNNGENDMYRWVDELKKSQRILIVYGQNNPLTEEEKKNVEDFALKYNCVIVTDTISNYNSSYSLNPYVMLNSISQEEFNKNLAPDILITVGGKRLMNDPLTFKIRGCRGVRHWSITPGGTIKDFYFKLTSVIDSSQNYFFKWFAEKAGDIKNNQTYFNAWKNLTAKYLPNQVNGFNSIYIQSRFLPSIPENSFLHLGVGQSFFDVRKFNLNPSVEVFCNMGTNGIDGCTSTFMGQCAVIKNRLAFLLVGDLSFFYDMNSIWNKKLDKNMRILLVNNNGSGLLRGHNLKAVTSVHNTSAEGWVRSTGFEYMSAKSKEEFDNKLKYFISEESDKPLFFEVFCD